MPSGIERGRPGTLPVDLSPPAAEAVTARAFAAVAGQATTATARQAATSVSIRTRSAYMIAGSSLIREPDCQRIADTCK